MRESLRALASVYPEYVPNDAVDSAKLRDNSRRENPDSFWLLPRTWIPGSLRSSTDNGTRLRKCLWRLPIAIMRSGIDVRDAHFCFVLFTGKAGLDGSRNVKQHQSELAEPAGRFIRMKAGPGQRIFQMGGPATIWSPASAISSHSQIFVNQGQRKKSIGNGHAARFPWAALPASP